MLSIGMLYAFSSYSSVRADLLEKFLAEYSSAAARLDEAYSHVKIGATVIRTDDKGKRIGVLRGEYLRNGDLVQARLTCVESNLANFPAGSIRVVGGSREKFFDISKLAGRDRFGFREFGTKNLQEYVTQMRIECAPVFAATCSDAVHIPSLLKSGYMRCLSATMVIEDGVELVQIDAEQSLPEHIRDAVSAVPGIQGTRRRMYFIPATWAFAGSSTPVGDSLGTVLQTRVRYAEGELPRVKSVHRWEMNNRMSGSKIYERNFIVESIEFGPIPHEQFTLAAFGVPEPVIPGTRTRLWWMMAINGPILLVLGIWFAVLAHRRRQRATSDGRSAAKMSC